MILALAASCAMALSAIVVGWQNLRVRSSRWGLYALRDQLRGKAIDDVRFRESRLFWDTDHLLTWLCHDIHSVSLLEFGEAFMRTRAPTSPHLEPHEDPEVVQYVRRIQSHAFMHVVWLLTFRHLPVAIVLLPLGMVLGLQKRTSDAAPEVLFALAPKRAHA